MDVSGSIHVCVRERLYVSVRMGMCQGGSERLLVRVCQRAREWDDVSQKQGSVVVWKRICESLNV